MAETEHSPAPAYVYMVRCAGGQLYTGWTNDPAARLHVADDDRARRDDRACAHAHALDDHGVGPDKHVVLDDDRGGAGGLDDPGQDRARADMAALAHSGPAAQDHAHVDHGALADHGADVQNRAHHNDGVLLNGHLLADDGAGLDAGRDVLHVQQRNGRVAAVVLDNQVLDVLPVGLENGLQVLPVAEDDLVARAEHLAALERERALGLHVRLHRRLLLGFPNDADDLVCVH